MALSFYDRYHQKNKNFYSPIKKNNLTYFYPLKYLHQEFDDFKHLKVLDVACGVGALSFYFASLGAKIKAIDISERAINICKKTQNFLSKENNKFKKMNFEKISIEKFKSKEKFDLVICSEIIEHVIDDDLFLKKVHQQLKKNGILYLSTPSPENILYKKGKLEKFDKEVGHLRRYTQKEIIKKLEKDNFKIKKNKQAESPLRNILFNSRLAILNKLIRGPLVPVFDLFDRFLINFFGYTDNLIIAQKI